MTRSEAYQWLALQLGLSAEECHMLEMSIETCHKVCSVSIAYDFDQL